MLVRLDLFSRNVPWLAVDPVRQWKLDVRNKPLLNRLTGVCPLTLQRDPFTDHCRRAAHKPDHKSCSKSPVINGINKLGARLIPDLAFDPTAVNPVMKYV